MTTHSSGDAARSAVSLRAALQSLPPYKPGKSAASSDVLQYKLSSNENPYGPSPAAMTAIVSPNSPATRPRSRNRSRNRTPGRRPATRC